MKDTRPTGLIRSFAAALVVVLTVGVLVGWVWYVQRSAVAGVPDAYGDSDSLTPLESLTLTGLGVEELAAAGLSPDDIFLILSAIRSGTSGEEVDRLRSRFAVWQAASERHDAVCTVARQLGMTPSVETEWEQSRVYLDTARSELFQIRVQILSRAADALPATNSPRDPGMSLEFLGGSSCWNGVGVPTRASLGTIDALNAHIDGMSVDENNVAKQRIETMAYAIGEAVSAALIAPTR